jgi:hypothetical protein
MVQQVAVTIDRPPPGHYQVRLSAVLSSVPAGDLPAPSPWPSLTALRRVPVRTRRRRTGQLALPLEQ